MKRHLILSSLLFALFVAPFGSFASPCKPLVNTEVDELPWATVQNVLKHVALMDEGYTYTQLVTLYHAGKLTVEQYGTGYLVTIYLADGIVDQIIWDGY